MSYIARDDRPADKAERYAEVEGEILAVLDGETNLTAKMATVSSMLSDAFEAFFDARRDRLCALIEQAMGKAVQRDLTAGTPTEDSSFFEPESLREDQSDGEA